MFKKKTVFILGAGASWHYGYPTGEELVRMVREKAEELITHFRNADGGLDVELKYAVSDENRKILRGEAIRRRPVHAAEDTVFEEFRGWLHIVMRSIEQANPLIIDDFLGRNDDIAEIGKQLIAMVLFECERNAGIRSGKLDKKTKEDTGKGDWVRYIVQQLTIDCEKPEKLLDNDVTFVTFNYDLSLERRLHQALRNYLFFAKDGFSDRFFDPGRFLHVYGQVYDFNPSQPDGPENKYSDGVSPLVGDYDRACDAAQNIRTISPHEKAAASEIVKAIADAEYLYFLGYGFDRRNNELLGLGKLSDMSKRQYVNFTNYGNLNKISKSVERIYAPFGRVVDVNGDSLGSLLGENFQKRSFPGHSGSTFICEKSIKSVYEALAEDFDWPE